MTIINNYEGRDYDVIMIFITLSWDKDFSFMKIVKLFYKITPNFQSSPEF